MPVQFGAAQFRAALAAGGVLAILLAPGAATSSTIVLGGGSAAQCSQLAISGRYDTETVNACNKAIEEEFLRDADYAKTLVNRGVVHMRRKNLNNASRDFASAQRVMPKLPEIYINRAVVLIKQGKYQAAVAEADTGIALGPDEPEKAYFNRALAREAAGDVKGAYYDFAKAAQLKPDWDAPQKELTRFTVQKAS